MTDASKNIPYRNICPELFYSDFNSIFNSANLLYMRDTFLTMINHLLEATLEVRPSLK